MDTTAHRIIKQARDALVDGLDLGLRRLNSIPAGENWPTGPHGLDQHQRAELDAIVWQLFDLMNDDPAPPECQECATPIEQPATGRPRRFCSDACRQRHAHYSS